MKCLMCRKKAGSSDRPKAVLNVGCMRKGKRKDETVSLSDAEAKHLSVLFSVSFHPSEAEQESAKPRQRIAFADVDFPDAGSGQSDLLFCSTACMRTWFNRLVDHVERNARIGRSKRDPVYRMTKFVK